MKHAVWTRAATALAVSALLCTGAAIAVEPGPWIVGDAKAISISTPSPYPVAFGSAAREWTIHDPGATYIRVHFSRFSLADGDHVRISNPWGTEAYTYEGRGPHGDGSFWAFAIVGDTAVIRLEASVGGDDGFEIDQYGSGFEPIFGDPIEDPVDPQPDSVCGLQDWQDVKCYENSYPTEYENARGAVKALIGCCSACTAFKVSDSGQFLTNNHCTSSQSGVQSTELRFEYQNSACGGGSSGYTGSVMGSQMLATGYTQDYTLMTTSGDSSSIPCLQLDDRVPGQDERIYIAHHPSGGVKKLSIESTHSSTPSGLCEADFPTITGRAVNSDVGYYCDTTNGSSGSPVLSGETHAVIALHHYGGCPNSGGRMDLILDEIGSLVDSCSGGSEPVCGNGICEAGEDELNCPEDCTGSEPFCGDGTCDATEDSCSCAADCGSPPANETSCSDGLDNDCDGWIDGADPDCQSTCTPPDGGCDVDSDCCSNKCVGSAKKGKFCK